MDALGNTPAIFGDPGGGQVQAESVSVLDRDAEMPSGLRERSFFLRSPSCSLLPYRGWWRENAGEIYVIMRKVRSTEAQRGGR